MNNNNNNKKKKIKKEEGGGATFHGTLGKVVHPRTTTKSIGTTRAAGMHRDEAASERWEKAELAFFVGANEEGEQPAPTEEEKKRGVGIR